MRDILRLRSAAPVGTLEIHSGFRYPCPPTTRVRRAAVAATATLDPELMKPGSAEETSHAVLFSDFSPGGAVDLLNSPASSREEGHADPRILFEGPFLQIVRSEKT